MWPQVFLITALVSCATDALADEAGGQPAPGPVLYSRPNAFTTLVNPACSHCRDEAKRRAGELTASDRVLCWLRGYSDGGAIPIRFFLSPYRVISDSYGVFVYDPDAGYARGFDPSYEFRFQGWRDGVMVMRHKDGTLYSCLSGLAFDGPRKGSRLKPIPTAVSDWGYWLEHYPNAVAYHMFDKYKPIDLPTTENPDSVTTRRPSDPRLKADEIVVGVRAGSSARAYPVAALEREGLIRETIGDKSLIVLWEPRTRTGSAFRPVASQPRKYRAPRPDATGVSPPDEGIPVLPAGGAVEASRKLTFSSAAKSKAGRFVDAETGSVWDVAGRCVEGKLAGWTLEWIDSVQVKWFAWAAEYPRTTVYGLEERTADDLRKKTAEIAGTAEFLRLLPKPFGTLQAVDPKKRTVTLLIDGEQTARTWPVDPDAEVKVGGFWGRLEQFEPGERVWAWLRLDRKRQPVSVVMLADLMSEYDMHGSMQKNTAKFAPADVEVSRSLQKTWLGKEWARNGLPGTLTFHHIFSGELEIALDHEAMKWARSLAAGDVVHLTAEPPIKGVVTTVTAWRERTVLRLVVGELESSELKPGQRLGLKMTPPVKAVEDSPYPPDIDRRRSPAERVDWFLANIYCTCGVSKDICTGDFYTLASCNPNGCGMPKHRRDAITAMIHAGLTDRQILDKLLEESGPLLLKPHLRP